MKRSGITSVKLVDGHDLTVIVFIASPANQLTSP
jgi:hypothetical protein